MKRLFDIKARALHTASKESGTGAGKMRIPGMKIGSPVSALGPSVEDILWMADKLETIVNFLKTAEFKNDEEMHMARKLVRDIEEGR